MIEAGEEELFDLRVAMGIGRAVERARAIGAKRIGHR
jgi:hypothetical protein